MPQTATIRVQVQVVLCSRRLYCCQRATMMPSSSSNNSRNCSSTRIQRSSLVLFLERQAYDMSNLCLNQQAPSLYPESQVMQQLPDFDARDTLQLWQQLPLVAASFQKDNTKQLLQHHASPPSPGPLSPTSLSLSPLRSVQSSHERTTTPHPSTRENSPRRSSAPVIITRSTPALNNCIVGLPAARPKLDYKRVYCNGNNNNNNNNNSRRSIVGGSRRHISFQEQQLQRTLEEERKIHEVVDDRKVDEISISATLAPLEPSYPMPCPLEELSFSRPSYLMPCPIDLPPLPRPSSQQGTRLVHVQPGHSHKPVVPKDAPFQDEKASLKTMEKESLKTMEKTYRQQARSSRSPSPLPTTRHIPCTDNPCMAVMELSPNVFVPYRGSQETWEAVLAGRFTVTTCFACSLQLVVMDSVEYLVCPDCQTVSPLCFSGRTNERVDRLGVGLGIKREWCNQEGGVSLEEQPADEDEIPAPPASAAAGAFTRDG